MAVSMIAPLVSLDIISSLSANSLPSSLLSFSAYLFRTLTGPSSRHIGHRAIFWTHTLQIR